MDDWTHSYPDADAPAQTLPLEQDWRLSDASPVLFQQVEAKRVAEFELTEAAPDTQAPCLDADVQPSCATPPSAAPTF